MEDRQYDLFFSVSRYKQAKDCLGKYYFQHVKKIKIPFIVWPGTLYGTVVHLLIENIIGLYNSDEDFRSGIIKYKNGELKKSPADKIVPDLFEKLYEEQYKIETDKKSFRKSRGFSKEETIKQARKWTPKIIDFMIKFVGLDNLTSEMKITSDVDDLNMRITSYIDLIKKEDESNIIYDIKNTKKPSGYFFKDWTKDIQSNVYIALLDIEKGLKPTQFGYLVFSIEDNLIFANCIELNEDHIEESKKYLASATKELHDLHQVASDTSFWSPDEERCNWCDFNLICQVTKKIR